MLNDTMKKINFLVKLYKEKKLMEVEQSDEIKKAYFQRSNESLTSAKALLKIEYARPPGIYPRRT